MNQYSFYPVFDHIINKLGLPEERELFLKSRGSEWRQARRIAIRVLRDSYKMDLAEINGIFGFKSEYSARNLYTKMPPAEIKLAEEVGSDCPPLNKARSS
jgi:hypothetical protein